MINRDVTVLLKDPLSFKGIIVRSTEQSILACMYSICTCKLSGSLDDIWSMFLSVQFYQKARLNKDNLSYMQINKNPCLGTKSFPLINLVRK